MTTAPTSTRHYIRIPTIVPVGFQLLAADHTPLGPDIRTGFTRDLSEGVVVCTPQHRVVLAMTPKSMLSYLKGLTSGAT